MMLGISERTWARTGRVLAVVCTVVAAGVGAFAVWLELASKPRIIVTAAQTEFALPADLRDQAPFAPNFMWRLDVENRGGSQTNVRLVVPHIFHATAYRRGEVSAEFGLDAIKNPLDLGTVLPDERLTVHAWGTEYLGGPRPSIMAQPIEIYVTDGSGKVRYGGLVGPWWNWMATYSPVLVALLVTAIFSVILVRLVWSLIQDEIAKRPNAPTTWN